MKNLKIIALLVLGISLIIIVVQNTAPVPARILWYEAELPMIVLLFVVAIGAFVAGILVSMLRSKKKASASRRSTERKSGRPPQQGE